MKKLFTLVMLALCTLGIDAQEESRKVWDFRQGFSQETIDNMTAAAAEGLGYTNQYNAETGIGYFECKARTAGKLTVKVNGEDWEVPETKGLSFGAVSNQHLNIVIGNKNYGPHVWLNGKKGEDYVQIDEAIPAGEKVVIIYSSHKDSEGRGFKVSGNFKDENGKQQWTISKRTDTEEKPDMYLDTVTVINTGEEAAKLKMSTTNGMHFHLIAIGGMPGSPETTKQVAYLYDSAVQGYSSDDDYIPGTLLEYLSKRIKDYELKTIDLATKGVTREQLESFDAVVLGFITPQNPNVEVLKSAISYTPMLNLGTDLYGAWGYGAPTATAAFTLSVDEKYRTNALFNSLDTDEPLVAEDGTMSFLVSDADPITGVNIAEGYFQNDEVIATAGGVTAMHLHNLIGRNAYLLLPVGYTGFIDENGGLDLLVNAVKYVADTKKAVTKTSKPQIIPEYKDLKTEVTLKCSTKGAVIYYTTDGSEPTEQSTVYDGQPLLFTAPATVKAIAFADGYNLSDVQTVEVGIFRLAKTPVISVEQQDGGKALVSIEAEDIDAQIYFNLTGSKLVSESQLYTFPFELDFNATVTAFVAEMGELLQSELAQQTVSIPGKKFRSKVIESFDGNTYSGPSLEKGYSYYTDEVIDTQIFKDQNGEDSVVEIFATRDSVTYVRMNNWQARTWGQGIGKLNASPGHAIHDVTGYNPYSVFDEAGARGEITGNAFQFSGNNASGIPDQDKAALYTVVPLQGPFDVVVYASGKNTKCDIAVATDTLATEWTLLGKVLGGTEDLMDGSKDASNRIWRRTIVSYEGTDLVYVKLQSGGNTCNIFNVLIKVEDESEGIDEMPAKAKTVAAGIYSISGMRQQAMQRGLNIVVGTDGSVRKVMVK